ncbi:hypothetical protein KP509_19G029100 [Ceratopteris richardii]|uniref:Uncharacterized protein n=1 Tax=Ceratopteris richardii TaxID=49495 RepID=A0A8T2SKV4_CERRI|nr:hypothetical protein KP509_19G029100 [Ceratopteris richardii]
MSSTAAEFKVKFLVSLEKQKIVYMETGKDFVDVLLGLLQLPIVSALSFFALSNGENRLQAGSLTTLYSSLQKMNTSRKAIFCILHALPFSQNCGNFQRILSESHYPCLLWSMYVTPVTSGQMASIVRAIPVQDGGGDMKTPATEGFVQSYLTFIISDDLNIIPASTIESIMMLSRHGVKSLADLYSVDGRVSSQQVFEVLRASFTSSTVLNDVFRNAIPSSPKR